MPLDNTFDNDAFKRRCIGWEMKFAVLPKKCHYSQKMIWLELAYRGTALWTGPGESLFEHRWISKNQYLIQKIKGSL